LRSDFGEGFGDCCDERFDGSGGDLSQQGFEFSEELFDGVEVWAVRGQVAQLRAGGLDGFGDAGGASLTVRLSPYKARQMNTD
jgi:hypothetical protein